MHNEMKRGHVLDVLRLMADDLYHLMLTSPPYFQLRDYGTPHQKWSKYTYVPMVGLPAITIPAWTGELGQEPTLEMFIGHLVEIFAEVFRVLRDDGLCFVNLGETFAKRSGKGEKPQGGVVARRAADGAKRAEVGTSGQNSAKARTRPRNDTPPPGLKAKDRMAVPERFVLAMMAIGFHYRDEIVWHKPSCMPESASDRCTRAHEMVFMFSKTPVYFFDGYAIRDKSTGTSKPRGNHLTPKAIIAGKEDAKVKSNPSFTNSIRDVVLDRHPRSVWSLSAEPTKIKHFACWPQKLARKIVACGTSAVGCCPDCHAPFAPVLHKRRVATRVGKQSKIYHPTNWAVSGDKSAIALSRAKVLDADSPYQDHNGTIVGNRDPLRHCTVTHLAGWRPTCACERWGKLPTLCARCKGKGRARYKSRKNGKFPMRLCKRCKGYGRYADVNEQILKSLVPANVLDIFGGAGTTNLVCDRMGRSCTSIELSENYANAGDDRLHQDRMKDVGPLFTGGK